MKSVNRKAFKVDAKHARRIEELTQRNSGEAQRYTEKRVMAQRVQKPRISEVCDSP